MSNKIKKAILGTKIGMTQIFTASGEVIPVTVVQAGPCVVVQKKTIESDGYESIQVGYGEIREKLVNKPVKGHFAKANLPVKRHLKEFRMQDCSKYEVGTAITVEDFANGDIVDVSGVSRGHGFSGSIQRWNQSRGRMTHGSHFHRSPGSMSANSSPSRVFKTKRLPGHWGHENVTVQNLVVVQVDADNNLLLIKGAIPGAKGGMVEIRNAVKA